MCNWVVSSHSWSAATCNTVQQEIYIWGAKFRVLFFATSKSLKTYSLLNIKGHWLLCWYNKSSLSLTEAFDEESIDHEEAIHKTHKWPAEITDQYLLDCPGL